MNDVERLQKAMEVVSAGRYAEGEELARAVPPGSAVFPQACHILGVAATQLGRIEEGYTLLLRAAVLGDRSTGLPSNLALAARAAGKLDADLVIRLREWLVTGRSVAETAQMMIPLLVALGFNKTNGYAHVETVFTHYALPMLRWSLDNNAFDHALTLEIQCYEHYVKQRETEEHFRDRFNTWVPDMLRAARRVGRDLPPLPGPRADAPVRIGFFIHNASTLAHIEALINMLTGYRQLAAQPFEPVVYCLEGTSDDMSAAFARIAVPVVHLLDEYPDTKGSHYRRLLKLRERLAADGACCVVWVSLAVMMPLAFGLRIAPVQIWWSMKYHGLAFDEIDGYVTSGSFSRTEMKQGRLWRSGRLQVANRYNPALKGEAEKIAEKFRPRRILGTLARHELIRSPRFLDAVVAVLQRNPDAVFLWTGREEAADISARFRDAGVLDRTHFIGWVDIKVYAQVLDVFLDTFPFGCGFTVLDTLAAGTPVVFMAADPATEDPSYDRIIWPMIEGRTGTAEDTALAREIFTAPDGSRLFLHAVNHEEYVALATRLLHEPDWAQAVGAAGRRFMEALMSDPSQSARDFADHFMAIIAERREKGFR